MKEIIKYVESDYKRYYKYSGKSKFFLHTIFHALTCNNHCYAYNIWFRLCKKKNILYPFALFMHYRLTRKYGIQIPIETQIGYGLYIGHGVGIIINGSTIIGNNCNISQFLTIGSNHGTPAVIGDNVYIGPSVCLVENVHIGNNVTIGAGSVVTKDIPANATIAGVPARILNFDNPGRYIKQF